MFGEPAVTSRSGPDQGGASAPQALFAWQILFLAFILGLLALEEPWAAGSGVPLLWFAARELRRKAVSFPLLVLAFALGLGYMALRAPARAPGAEPWMEARVPVRVRAVVDEVQTRPGKRLVLLLRGASCRVEGADWICPGLLAWTWEFPTARPLPGQDVEFTARLRPLRGFGNPGQWDFEAFWERQDVAYRTYLRGAEGDLVLGPEPSFRAAFRDRLRRAADAVTPPGQGGAVVLASITGDRFRLEPETLDLMRDAGLSHSLALSGMNLAYVAVFGVLAAYALGFVWPGVYLRLPRPKLAVLLGLPLVLAYAWIGQPAPSLVRAAWMFVFWSLLLLLDRGRILLDGLFLALAVILLLSPLEVHEVGLQLSAVAVAGIALFGPGLWRFVPKRRGAVWWLLRWAWGLLSVSLAANLALLPLLARHFGALSPNFLANLLWLPVLGAAVTPLGIGGMFLAPLWPEAGVRLLSWAAALTEAVLDILRLLDGAGFLPLVQALRPLWPELWGGALLLLCLALLLRSRPVPLRLAGLGLLLLVLPQAWVLACDGLTGPRLELVDVGQGQAVLVTAPGGQRTLVDGGGFNSRTFDVGQAVLAPALTWGRPPRLERVVLTHPDTDHSQGLRAVLGGFQVERFAWAGPLPEGFPEILERQGLNAAEVRAGDVLSGGPGLVFQVLNPPPGPVRGASNDHSVVLRLVREGRGLALLCGDVGRRGLADMLRSGADLSVEVLVLPHHGSKSALSPEFYRAARPRLALASTGYLNGYGFPHSGVVEALKRQRVPVFTTARCGALELVWDQDGGKARLEGFRPPEAEVGMAEDPPQEAVLP